MKPLLLSSSFVSYMASIGVHAAVLLGAGWSLVQNVQYGVQESNSSMQVDLVAFKGDEAAFSTNNEVNKSTFEKLPEPEEVKERIPSSDASDIPITEMVKPERSMQRPARSEVRQPPVSPSLTHGRDAVNIHSDQGAIVRVNPQYLKNPPPYYPEAARQKKQEGVVVLSIIVSKEGTPIYIKVSSGSGYELLDRAASEAVARWKFKPARVGGVEMLSQVEVPIRFKLN